jgi:hypothetical protein
MNRPATPYLAEVTEDAAQGEIARIYGEIRSLTAVPFVALIYRHLATIPGALEAVWQAARSPLESGQLQERAWQLGRDAWSGTGVDATDDLRELDSDSAVRIGDVIAAYSRANPVNLAIVALIQQTRRDEATGSRGVEREVWTPPPMIPALPPIPPMAALPADVRACVDAFGKPGPSSVPVLVPTLYRHLAHWPAFLAFAQREVLPRLASGAFEPVIDRFRSAIRAEAARLGRPSLTANEPLLRELAPVLDRFTGVIPEMVVVGSFLARSLTGRLDANRPGRA